MIPLIENDEPATWDDLELRVADILREAGLDAQRGVSVSTVRGPVAVDVRAVDTSVSPAVVTLVECKHWKRPVPQTVAHAFRTVVVDSGANTGIIVSRRGFQAGTELAVAHSNVHLVDWRAFQTFFSQRWYRTHMMPRGRESLSPLLEYTEPINSRISRKADALSETARTRFRQLQQQYRLVAIVLAPIFFDMPPLGVTGWPLSLPLNHSLTTPEHATVLPPAIAEAPCLRDLLEADRDLVRGRSRGVRHDLR